MTTRRGPILAVANPRPQRLIWIRAHTARDPDPPVWSGGPAVNPVAYIQYTARYVSSVKSELQGGCTSKSEAQHPDGQGIQSRVAAICGKGRIMESRAHLPHHTSPTSSRWSSCYNTRIKGCYSVLGRQRYLGARPHPGRRQSQTVRGQTYMSPRVLGFRGGGMVRRGADCRLGCYRNSYRVNPEHGG